MTKAVAHIELLSCRRNWFYFQSLLLAILFTLSTITAFCQQDDSFEEISIMLNVQRIGSVEIPAIIHREVAYLPVKEVFDFLKIKSTLSTGLDSVTGNFINPKSAYVIDKVRNVIVYENKTVKLKANELISTETNLYLKADYFGQVFALDCAFNFRSLSVMLNTKVELPAIREMQLEQMRRNVSQLKGEKKADTTISRKYPMFSFGSADWSVVAMQAKNEAGNTRLNLGLGGIIAGGETNLNLIYNSEQPFNKREQYYRWRFVNNDNAALRQVMAGRIFAQATSTMLGPVTGVQFTNTPTTYRRSFGTYRLSSTTEPGWLVELYVNNVLVNYLRADASGFFTFEVPMVYGNSVVRLRFYGPWGEERTREQNITIPFNFLPAQQFEYTVTAGFVDDEEKSKFSRANLNYGLSRHITIGGGVEYLSTVNAGKAMPFINGSVRVGSRLLISGEHTEGVRSKGIISYRLPSNVQFDANYIKYANGQTAIRYNFLEEKRLVLSVPMRTKKFTSFSRLTVHQYTLPKTKFNSVELLTSAVVAGVSSNLTTSSVFSDPSRPFIYSNLSLTFRLPAGIRFTPQAQYGYRQKNFSMLKAELEKSIFNKGFVSASFEKDNVNKNQYMVVGLRYNFSFAQTSFSVRHGNGSVATTQIARGSLLYNDKVNSLRVSNQVNIGRGGLVVLPFLDLNNNGKRDAHEPKAAGLKVHVNGGRIERNVKDTSITVTGLEAYNNYFVDLDKNSFDNIGWQIRKPTINVLVEPNHFKLIEVPVAVVGEVSGNVYLKGPNGSQGLGRVIINFYDAKKKLVARTVTESDGFFSYLGLGAGKYTARIDEDQLMKLGFTSAVKASFIITQKVEGDVVEGVDLIMDEIKHP